MKVTKTLNTLVRQTTQIIFGTTLLITAGISQAQSAAENEWIQLFNGDNLDNWKIKFTGFELGENYRDHLELLMDCSLSPMTIGQTSTMNLDTCSMTNPSHTMS